MPHKYNMLQLRIHKNIFSFTEKTYSPNFDVGEDKFCLNLFTSGLWGFPSALLTLRNILSQEAGKEHPGNGENDRFHSFLPWHHCPDRN